MRAGISYNLHGDGHLTSIGARFETRKRPELPGETAAKLLHAGVSHGGRREHRGPLRDHVRAIQMRGAFAMPALLFDPNNYSGLPALQRSPNPRVGLLQTGAWNGD